MNNNWQDHNENVSRQHLPMAATLAKALALLRSERVKPGVAIDLGCGSGVDAISLLLDGWHVVAIDKDQGTLKTFEQSVPQSLKTNLKIVASSFVDIKLPTSLLINASFSLPFCHPDRFINVWSGITESLLPGGIFAGHFFGPNDSWAIKKEMTFHKRSQLLTLFGGFKIESFDEIDKSGTTLSGNEKHWHVFHVVLRKRLA
jgi:tellurite methyltransferase